MIRATQAQAAHFILQKNYLTEPATSLTDVVERLVGLPAQPPETPHLAAVARLAAFRPADLLDTLHRRRTLIEGSLMRSQLTIVPVESFALYHAATTRQRRQNLNSELRMWGLENEEIERWGAAILAVTANQPHTAEAIAAQLPPEARRDLSQTSRGGWVSTTSPVAQALRWLTATGDLYAGRDPAAGAGWRSGARLYAPLAYWYPDIDLSDAPDEATAQATVVRRYLAAFGPATEADISFWTGFGKSETARAVSALSGETTLALVENIPGMTLLLKSQAESLSDTSPPAEPVVKVLPADDPFTTAHRASRGRYFRDQSRQRQVFSSTGAAKPAIIVNGQIVGVWQLPTADSPPTWHLLDEAFPMAQIQPQLEVEFERIGRFLE